MRLQRIERLSELALLRALPDLIIGDNTLKQKSRMGNLYRQLQKHVDFMLKTFAPISTFEISHVESRILSFAKTVEWEKQERDVSELMSFLLAVIDSSESVYPDKITKNLYKAFEHLTSEYSQEDIDKYVEDAEKAIKVWKLSQDRIRA